MVDERFILKTYNRLNLEIDKIRGNYIYTKDGEKYLDFFSGIAVNNLGYDEEVIKAMTEKMQCYTHISNYFCDDDRSELARVLIENSMDGRVFYTNTGTESSEAALKLVRKWGKENNKHKILTAKNSFHGRTTGALVLTGQKKYQKDFEPLISGVDYFIFNDSDSLSEMVNDNTVAIFLETVQGEGGVVPLTDSFVQTLMLLKEKYKFILVMDEIQTGLRRCGTMFAYENYNIKPDIILLSKSLGGGLPLGAMIVSKDLENVLGVGDHGSTFGGNPVACAGGLAVVRKLTDDNFVAAINKNADYLFDKLSNLKEKYPEVIRDLRGISFMLGLDVGDYASLIKEKAMKEKVLINVTSGTVIRLIPPLTINTNDIDMLISVLEKIISGL